MVFQAGLGLGNSSGSRRGKYPHGRDNYLQMRPREYVHRLGSSVIAGVPLAAGLGAVTAPPAQATLTFTNTTTPNGTNVHVATSQVFISTSGGLSISTGGRTHFSHTISGGSPGRKI